MAVDDSPDETQPRPEDDPEIAALLNFKPAPRQKRGNGWTPAFQRKFIAHLALTGSPELAAEAVRKNRHGVQKVYRDNRAEEFRAAWDAAVALFEQREADRIEREQAGLVGVTPPFVDRRKKRSSPSAAPAAPPSPEGEGWGEDIPPIPVICDKCSAEGAAGDEAFADIPYLLAFEPVPRPAHDRLWDAPTQRAFVAALAVTGSVERAARSIKRQAFAVEKLRKSRGSREFNEACEAALDVARQRELAKMGGKLSELGSGVDDGSMEAAQQAEYEAARERIQMRLTNCRRLYLWEICEDEAKRAAWELLCGPTDWEKAKRPIRGYGASDAAGAFETGTPNMREPSMILPVQNGWLAEMAGGEDKTAQLRAEVEKEERESAESSEQSPATRELFERREASSAEDPQSGVDRRHAIHSRDQNAQSSSPARRGPRIYNLNSPEAFEVLCPRDSRPWIPAGSLPREKRPDRGAPVQVTALPAPGETGVQAETDNEEAAKEAFKEWQAHVDAGRIGSKRKKE
jgi:hypothetical protein